MKSIHLLNIITVQQDSHYQVPIYDISNEIHHNMVISNHKTTPDKYPQIIHSSAILDLYELHEKSKAKQRKLTFNGKYLNFGRNRDMYYPFALKYQNIDYAKMRIINSINTDKNITFDFIYSTAEIKYLSVPDANLLRKFAVARLKEMFTPERYYIYHIRLTFKAKTLSPRFLLVDDDCYILDIIKSKKSRIYRKHDFDEYYYNIFSLLKMTSFDVEIKIVDSIYAKHPKYNGPLFFKMHPWKEI